MDHAQERRGEADEGVGAGELQGEEVGLLWCEGVGGEVFEIGWARA